MTNALILIGLQVDFFPLGAAEMPGSEAILPVVSEWMPRFEQVVAARFSHPASHKMFVANYPWRRPGQVIDLLGDKILLKNFHCVEGSFGAELASVFDHGRISHQIQMGTENKWLPHSAFYDERKARDTGLLTWLRERNVKQLHIAGLPFEETVAATVLDALELGFSVAVIEQAILAADPTRMKASRDLLEKAGAIFV